MTPADLGINITPDIVTGPPILYFYGTGLYHRLQPRSGPTTFANTVYAYYDNLSWTKGKHNMKFGFSSLRIRTTRSMTFYGNGVFSFYGPSTSAGRAPIWPISFRLAG